MGQCTSMNQKPTVESKSIPTEGKKRRRKKNIPITLKRAVWDTYIGAEKGMAPCMCCEKTMIQQMQFHCGHVIAEAEGGKTNVENLRPICAQCNLSMGKKNLYEFKAKYFEDTTTSSKKSKK
jgi:HNH endonuclease